MSFFAECIEQHAIELVSNLGEEYLFICQLSQ